MKKIGKILLIMFSIIVIYVIFINSKDEIMKKMYPRDYSNYVEKYAKEYELSESLIFAIIKNESNFIKDITSNKGAKGLMQIMDKTAEEVAIRLNIENFDLLDPETNIKIGSKYFAELYKKYNNSYLALAAYNAGTGNVDKWINQGILKPTGEDFENIPFKETNMYIRKVIQTEKIYKALYD